MITSHLVIGPFTLLRLRINNIELKMPRLIRIQPWSF